MQAVIADSCKMTFTRSLLPWIYPLRFNSTTIDQCGTAYQHTTPAQSVCVCRQCPLSQSEISTIGVLLTKHHHPVRHTQHTLVAQELRIIAVVSQNTGDKVLMSTVYPASHIATLPTWGTSVDGQTCNDILNVQITPNPCAQHEFPRRISIFYTNPNTRTTHRVQGEA